MNRLILPPLAGACAAALAALAPTVAAAETALTVYSASAPGTLSADALSAGGRQLPGFAVVRETRALNLAEGRSEIRFTDVAALIDPTTVTFESLTDPAGTRVVEQSFQFDLVDSARLLERYVDRDITVEQAHGGTVDRSSGKLLSTAGGLTLLAPDGKVRIVRDHRSVELPSLPGGLITRPTLVWDIAARRGGTHQARVGYQTEGLSWWADYNVEYVEAKDGACRLDVGAWVTLVNRSGATFSDARLKLVAGDVQRVRPAVHPRTYAPQAAMGEAKVAGFEEKTFFEYHLYTLGRPTTLPDRSTKQIELFGTARGVACEKRLVYEGSRVPPYAGPEPLTDRAYGAGGNRKVDVLLEFANRRERGLGMPLPAGKVRVSQRDPADQSLEFVGEDVIDHTPKDEKLRVRLGSSFDIVGERRQADFKVDTRARTLSETIEVQLRNHKDRAVEVTVREPMYRWLNWSIAEASHEFARRDARTVEFLARVAANGETVVRYTVRYSW
ncbi:MAG: DUF4139 domain-containing protein [Pseudomonadota bacterium]